MDRVETYRTVIRQVLNQYAEWTPSSDEISTEVIADPRADHYELMRVGWDGRRKRVHTCVIHLDIIAGKIWIQHDGTNRPVAEELLAAGVPKEVIVLGFQPADIRPHTEFAVG